MSIRVVFASNSRRFCCNQDATMTIEPSPTESEHPDISADTRGAIPSWIKVSAITVASALAGGMAAAWFYRKTLSRLRKAESEPQTSTFQNTGDE